MKEVQKLQQSDSDVIEMLKNSKGELKAVAFPSHMTGSGYHPPVLFWKIEPRVWEAGRPTMEISYASDADGEIKIDERFVLPAREGSLIMARDIRYHRVRYPEEAIKVMRQIAEQAQAQAIPPDITLSPQLVENRDENGELIGCAYADEAVCGYGWQEKVLYWRLTEAAWETEPEQIAKVMYTPEDGSAISKIVYDEILDIKAREGSVLLKREIAYALVCSKSFAEFIEL